MKQPAVSRTLLVAWDAADWLMIEPMLEAGQLPNLQSLVNTGLLGWFSVPAPLDPAVLVNSLRTGFPPEIHGILAHPSSATDRRLPDLAERFAAAGHLAISAGWPASHGTGPRPNLLRVSDVFDEDIGNKLTGNIGYTLIRAHALEKPVTNGSKTTICQSGRERSFHHDSLRTVGPRSVTFSHQKCRICDAAGTDPREFVENDAFRRAVSDFVYPLTAA